MFKKSIVGCFMLVCVSGCSAAFWQSAKDVSRHFLSASELACVLLSSLTDERAVADACRIEEALRPALREALSGKSSASNSGVCK